MSATIAPWRRHPLDPPDAHRAQNPVIPFAERRVAADACPRQQEIQSRAARDAGPRNHVPYRARQLARHRPR
jgi:hypothetical protein